MILIDHAWYEVCWGILHRINCVVGNQSNCHNIKSTVLQAEDIKALLQAKESKHRYSIVRLCIVHVDACYRCDDKVTALEWERS